MSPLSTPFQGGLRFFHPPLPAALSASLAGRFPFLEGYGFPVFRAHARSGGGPSFPPGASCSRQEIGEFLFRLLSFWFRPLSTFGLFLFPAFSRSSPRLPLPLSASASPPWCWQKHRLLAISMPVL